MKSEQHLYCKYVIDSVYFEHQWDPRGNNCTLQEFMKSIGTEIDEKLTHQYVIVDEKKWLLAKLKYGI